MGCCVTKKPIPYLDKTNRDLKNISKRICRTCGHKCHHGVRECTEVVKTPIYNDEFEEISSIVTVYDNTIPKICECNLCMCARFKIK